MLDDKKTKPKPKARTKTQKVKLPEEEVEQKEIMRGVAREILAGDVSRYVIDGVLEDLSPCEIARRMINNNEGMTTAEAMLNAFAMRAIFFGDVASGTFVRDTAGEKPKEKTEIDNKIEVSFSMQLTGNTVPSLMANNPIEIIPANICEVDEDAEA